MMNPLPRYDIEKRPFMQWYKGVPLHSYTWTYDRKQLVSFPASYWNMMESTFDHLMNRAELYELRVEIYSELTDDQLVITLRYFGKEE